MSASDSTTPADSMPELRALIVDDVPENRLELVEIVRRAGFVPIEAVDGEQAVAVALATKPHVILMDVVLPKMDGLEALEHIREQDPLVPVVVMTASEDATLGERALRVGAVNFIRSPFDLDEIDFVLHRIRGALQEQAEQRAARELILEQRTIAEIDNDPARIEPLVSLLGRELRFHYTHQLPVTEIKLALYEALANAIEHGNLEIGYAGKTKALESPTGLRALIAQRREQANFCARKVRLEAIYTQESITYKIRDEGCGFRRDEVERLRSSEAPTTALHGRGLLLIKHYMDSVEWNDTGNEITMRTAVHPEPPGASGSD